jgi:hypothetical protein
VSDVVIEMILEQMFLNKNSNFLFESFPDNINISEEISGMIQDSESEVYQYFNNLDDEKIEYISNFMTNKCIKIFLYNNQYLYFEENYELVIKDIYINLLKTIKSLVCKSKLTSEKLQEIIHDHHINLKKFLIETNRNEMLNIDKYEKNIKPTVCSEYSAIFQLNILGIDLNNISEPILDIGCGTNGNLVKYLREIGLDAYGIERDVDIETEFIEKVNWLEYKVEKNKWGTIISNMAFSNHFFHNHINKNPIEVEYFNKFKEILEGLKKSGTFVYAPGLEFIEEIFEDEYKIVKFANHNLKNKRLYTTKISII